MSNNDGKQASWYYEMDGRQIGPVSEYEIKACVETSFLSYGSMVWQLGSPSWVKLENSALKHLLLGNTPPPLSSKTVQHPAMTIEQQFEKTSILLMIFLSIITAGIYIPVWFLRRTDAINSLQSEEKLSPDIFVFVIIIDALGLLLSFWEPGGGRDAARSFEVISGILNWIAIITILVQAFKVRRIFDEHFNIRLRKYMPFSGLATFFFGIFYLQYEINRFDLRLRL